MNLDLYVDTSRKGISIAISNLQSNLYEEIINEQAKGETLSTSLDNLLAKVNASLDDIKRILVTIGPGSFSGLRTGIAFCQGLAFSKKRSLYGVSTLQALECFAGLSESIKTAVIVRARNDYWYLRLNGVESFDSTEELIAKLNAVHLTHVIVDECANANESLKKVFEKMNVNVSLDTGIPLYKCSPLFDVIKPSLIQEANYIQPSYFEKAH